MPRNYHLRLTGYVGGWDFNTTDVDRACRENPEHIDILVDSTGGSAVTALSICHALQDHKSVHIHLRGMNASAATVVAMGADRITMARTGLFLIHCSRMEHFSWETMTADDIRKHIEKLDETARQLAKIDFAIASLYAKRTGMQTRQVLELMAKEDWLTAEEALKLGFIDEITDYDDEKKGCELSACLTDVMLSAGMPLPKTGEKKDPSFFARLFNAIKNPNPQMEDFKFPAPMASACGLASVALDAKGRATIQKDALEKIAVGFEDLEKKASEAEQKAKDAEAKAEAAAAELAELKAKTPAGSAPDKVLETGAENSIDEYCQSMLEASKTFKNLP